MHATVRAGVESVDARSNTRAIQRVSFLLRTTNFHANVESRSSTAVLYRSLLATDDPRTKADLDEPLDTAA